MTVAPGFFEGFDGPIEAWHGVVNTALAPARVSTDGNTHLAANGILGSPSNGAASVHLANGDGLWLQLRRPEMPWEEFVCEYWVKHVSGTTYLSFYEGPSSRHTAISFAGGDIQHRRVLTIVGNTPSLGNGDSGFVSHHQLQDASAGFMKSWVDGGSLLLDTTSQNTLQGGGGINRVRLSVAAGLNEYYCDDFSMRPRTILVDAVTGSKTDTPSALTGTTETANVYAWENDTEDSAGGVGDSSLASNEWRLYLRDVSFGPEEEEAVGFADDEVVTVTGLTGTILVNAPVAHYDKGLEPGSMFLWTKMHVLYKEVASNGTDNSDGTLIGGPADRADALELNDGVKKVRHTVVSESVTVNMDALSVSASGIDQIIGIQVGAFGQTDGGVVDGVQTRIYDNAANVQNEVVRPFPSSKGPVQAFFPLNGTGGQWVTGTGSGGVDSTEAGYLTGKT